MGIHTSHTFVLVVSRGTAETTPSTRHASPADSAKKLYFRYLLAEVHDEAEDGAVVEGRVGVQPRLPDQVEDLVVRVQPARRALHRGADEIL